ncbi:hypothetical protein GJ496_006498 [Pomphorhynchus laevis]|nr:hypothetical protein GJ496_006498 [Pomphorhynchus laevis]
MPTRNQIHGLLKYHVAPRSKQLKWVWQVQGNMIDPKVDITENLKNTVIFDPLNPPMKQNNKWISPRRHPNFEFLVDPLPKQAHKCWHDTPAFEICAKTKFELGITQACLLTNSKYTKGQLPEAILSSKKALTDEQHLAVEELIKEAFVLDPKKERLPPKIRYTRPWSIRCGDIGIPLKRKLFNLMDKLLLFSISQLNGIKSSINNYVTYNSPFFLTLPYGDDTVHFRRRCQLLLLNDKPLTIKVDKSGAFKKFSFDDLSPMFPTVGLRKENIYDTGFCSGHNRNLHTFVMIEEDQPLTEMPSDEFVPKMITHAFAHAVSEAFFHRSLKWNGDLGDDPVYVFGVGIVEECFHFIVFELNSLCSTSSKLNRNDW